MSWSERLLRNGLTGIVLILGGTLSACTMAPVYSDAQAVRQELAFTYAKPNSRYEQIVYQELRLHFGESQAPNARQLRVSLSLPASREALSDTVNPDAMRRVNATARLTILPPAGSTEPPVTIERTAAASYTTNAQVFAAYQSALEARERAARAVAESLRLALLAGAVR